MSHVYRFTAEGQWDEFLAAYLILLDLPWTEPENPGLPPVLDRDWKIWIPIVVR